MTRDRIFDTIPAELLPQLSKTLGFDPVVVLTSAPSRLLSALSESEQIRWLGAHRNEVEDHFSFVGSSFLAYMAGNGKSYSQIVIDVAEKLNASDGTNDNTAAIEQSIIRKVWNDTVARMTPEQRQELLAQTEALAAKYGVGLGKELAGLASLTVAQMSGFGVYLLGSTLLGAINSALGLGLGFGAFTGLSSLISTVIGPVGWAALGLFTVLKLGRPNYKKLLPAIILIATARVAQAPALLPAPVPQKDSETEQTASSTRQATAHPLPSQTKASLAIKELQIEVTKAADQTRSKFRRHVQSGGVPGRISSKQEKTVFDLKHKSLADYTRNLQGQVHYLDLSSEDRALVDELYRQYLANQAEDAQERERNEQLRAENRKRESRLRSKGRTKQLDEERRRNFDKEFPDLAKTSAEYDPTRHYLGMNPDEQRFIKEYATQARKEASEQDALEAQRLSELEQAFAKASTKQQENSLSIPGPREGAKNGSARNNSRKRSSTTDHFQVVNLEAGYPTVEEARKRLSEEIKSANKAGVTVLKLIHGYGSTGNGGAIRNGIRHSLRRRTDGSLRVVVHGENWSIFGEDSRQLLEACPELKVDRDLDRSNPGVTFVLL
jgi:uncharacterized protein YaaW (UPF0174 family)/DNA-nicking Smr family endonuclease